MNKEELVQEVAKKTKASQKQVAEILSSAIEIIEKTVAKGKKVTLVGFGTFEPRKRAARTGRNPQTGAKIKIGASKAPKFRASSQLKDAVRSGKAKTAKKAAKPAAKKAKKPAAKKGAKR